MVITEQGTLIGYIPEQYQQPKEDAPKAAAAQDKPAAAAKKKKEQ